MTAFESSERFHRPDDLKVLRRNRRQIQAERLLAIVGRILFLFILVILSFWIFQRARQGPRFAIKSIQVIGVQHTSRTELNRVTAGYSGRNLFELNLEQIRRDLRVLPWIDSVAIEKQLPSTLKISVVERKPAALASLDGVLRYVDEHGRAFAELSPEVGNPDLPLINAPGRHLASCVRLLNDLKRDHPALYSRVSELAPAGENGFAIFDRDLKTTVFANAESIADKWLTLYAITAAEKFRSRPIEYVDLRFASRIIVKPRCSVLGAQCSDETGRELSTDYRAPSTGETR